MKNIAFLAGLLPASILAASLGRFDPWLPEEIALIPIELEAGATMTRRIDFKTDTRRYGDTIDYEVALISDSLNAEKSRAWDELRKRRSPSQHAYHLGEITLEWKDAKGRSQRQVFSGFAGYGFRSHQRYGLIIGGFSLPRGRNTPASATLTVTRSDSLLASLLGEAKFGIYRGGGK
jgi:hypothetical protein